MQHPLLRGGNGHARHRAMVKQAFGSSVATEISSLSHTAWDAVLFGLRLLLYQGMDLKGSDKVTTLSRANTHGTYFGRSLSYSTEPCTSQSW